MNIISGIGESGFLAHSALSAEVATKDSLGRNISETYLTGVDLISSQSGTIFVSGYEIEGTNSAITTATVQGFVTSFGNETIGPNLTATFGWDKSLPNTTFTFTTDFAPGGTIVSYSADTNLTGEIMAPGFTAAKLDISVPNATAIRLWSNNYVSCKANAASAADSVGMTVGELAWASALPTYQYDSSNKISAINGSALANYELPTSVSAATDCVTANSAIWNSVTGKLETTAFSDVSGTFLTSLPADVAYTGWVENSIVSATSGLQSSGNYIPYTATEDSLTAFETNSGLLIRRTALGGLKSTYIGDNVQVHYVNGGPQNLSGTVLSYNKLSFETNSDTAYVDREKIHKWDSASDYIQNNSATINEVNTSYQANSGSFLTAVDLTPYQTTAGMTAYQSAGDYLTTADSANFYTTANESGFITGIGGTYLQNTDLTITDGKITEISGVPLSAGDEFPQSATEAIETVTSSSAIWNETTDTVSSNSGAWGGSALPISAGPGIKVNLVDNTLVFSNDETVLYTGSPSWKQSITLSESPLNFARVKILFGNNLDTTGYTEKLYGSVEYTPTTANNYMYLDGILKGNSREWHAVSLWSGISGINWGTVSGKLYALASTESNTNNTFCSPYLIIGINRIAGGN